MLRRLSATPCPVPGQPLDRNRRDSGFSVSNDTTANLDFTTEFKASFRDVKPRRPPNGKRRPARAKQWTIHEDEELELETAPKSLGHTTSSDKQSSGAKSVQPKRRVSSVQTDATRNTARPDLSQSTTLSKAPRRLSIQPLHPPAEMESNENLPVMHSSRISQPARRGTMYIPSEDTTMPSMFMDLFSPLRKPPGPEPHQDQEPNMTGLAKQMVQKKGPRKSTLAASPKRGPLQPAINVQASSIVQDHVGQGRGKENLPPGFLDGTSRNVKELKQKPVKDRRQSHQTSRPSLAPSNASQFFEPTTSSNSRANHKLTNAKSKPKPGWNSNFLLPKPRRTIQQIRGDDSRSATPVGEQPLPTCSAPSRVMVPSLGCQLDQQYPFLPEGVVDASMYEQNWLGQQEIAITQLMNNLFDAAAPSLPPECNDDLYRLRSTEAYGSPSMVSIYKRLQSALLCGALRISRDVLKQGHQLHADLGRRKLYTAFWLDNYNPRLLKSGLEIVVGRIVPSRTSDRARHGECPNSPNQEQRPLRRFIEKFLIRNEDIASDRNSVSSTGASYQRTVLRSLMLVKLLDLMKTEHSLKSNLCLFQSGSAIKSSPSAVANIWQMLNPSAGDPKRALKSLGYSVHHVQYPLEEFDYQITNLAVDLRDGVRLTRLIELLLYRSASQSLGYGQDSGATTTITIPTGQTVALSDGHQDWPLSQHLKIPCISKATKLYNVQLALAALNGVRGMAGILYDINAEDVVDGFREKTVRLLWGLSSKWGLGGLVEWEDVRGEIKRLSRARGRLGHLYSDDFDLEEDEDGYLHFKSLLKAWVKAVATSHGLRVRNFTSDFADGRLFAALVSEYQPLLTSFTCDTGLKSLPERLRALGCSDEFGRLFAVSEQGGESRQIFDRDFVLASTAFLCSRLLRPTKTARAAIVVQRAWRNHWDNVMLQRKKIMGSLATGCAEQVRIRKAKACIWRAWCRLRARRACQETCKGQEVVEEEDVWLSL